MQTKSILHVVRETHFYGKANKGDLINFRSKNAKITFFNYLGSNSDKTVLLKADKK
jgi:hypothetical protein